MKLKSDRRPADGPAFIVVGVPSFYSGSVNVRVSNGRIYISPLLESRLGVSVYKSKGGEIVYNASMGVPGPPSSEDGTSPPTSKSRISRSLTFHSHSIEQSSIDVTGTGVIVKLLFADELTGRETKDDASFGHVPRFRRYALKLGSWCRKCVSKYRLRFPISSSNGAIPVPAA